MKKDEPMCQAAANERPGYWHTHRCMFKAKGVREFRDGRVRPVCGVHLRVDVPPDHELR